MPFRFSEEATRRLGPGRRCIEDRRNNPVRGRKTQFRLLTGNILAYTFDAIPGFTTAGINGLPFGELVDQPLSNARQEGELLYGADFSVDSNAVAKVRGDVFETVEAAVHWNAATQWNRLVVDGTWDGAPRYARPKSKPERHAQVASLRLPRRYDWVRLLHPDTRDVIEELRADLRDSADLEIPTSTPDLVLVRLPEQLMRDERFRNQLENLDHASQANLDTAYEAFEDLLDPSDFLLAVALKVSLRSDRLYQPLYEANIMQLLLEVRLGAPRVEFEVHALESAGTRAVHTYQAASIPLIASGDPDPHRAVRELYEPANASELVKRLFQYLAERFVANA